MSDEAPAVTLKPRYDHQQKQNKTKVRSRHDMYYLSYDIQY